MKTKLTLFVTVLAAALFLGGCATPETQLKTASSKTVELEIRRMARKGEGILTEVDYLKVGHINLHGKNVNDISLLAKCKNLTEINLTYNYILEDITPLKGLKKLRHLALDFNNISDETARLLTIIQTPEGDVTDEVVFHPQVGKEIAEKFGEKTVEALDKVGFRFADRMAAE